jgi:hypothetical protein
LVKFSGTDVSPTVQRWADLLVCEHLALQQAARLPGVAAATSRILLQDGRTFLEVERFNRHGDHGRSPLCTLETVNAAVHGDASPDWTVPARRLFSAGLLAQAGVAQVAHLWWFGRLIGPPRTFEPPLPLPPQRATWQAASAAALAFWHAAAEDARISAGFRQLCAGHAARLRVVAEHA